VAAALLRLAPEDRRAFIPSLIALLERVLAIRNSHGLPSRLRTDNASRGLDSLLAATASHPGMSLRTAPLGAGWRLSCPPPPVGGHRLGVLNRARARPPKQAFLAAIRRILPGPRVTARQRGRPGEVREPGSPSAASGIRLHRRTTRFPVGPRRRNHRDALSVKTARCVVGSHRFFRDRMTGPSPWGFASRRRSWTRMHRTSNGR